MKKGKLTPCSWSDLPPEVLRIVAEYVISSHNPWTPNQWEHELFEGNRRVWNMLANADLMSRLQSVCRQWEAALIFSRFWRHAIDIFDPKHKHPILNGRNLNDISPHVIYQEIINTSCVPCRINGWNYPTLGIAEFKGMERTTCRGWISCCQVHRPEMFCGVCLKEAIPRPYIENDPKLETMVDRMGRWLYLSFSKNEDTQSFPYCSTICGSCRRENLLSRLDQVLSPQQYHFAQEDLMCRTLLSPYADRGLGEIQHAVGAIEDRFWLLDNTRHEEYMRINMNTAQQPRATSRERVNHHLRIRDSIRQMALQTWARVRINEGCWVSPVDVYSKSFSYLRSEISQGLHAGISARHPFMGNEEEEMGLRFPRIPLEFRNPGPRLYQELQSTFEEVLQTILRPALQNCLHRLMAETEAEGLDITKTVLKVTANELLGPKYLNTPEIWLADYDWDSRYPPRDVSDESSPGSDVGSPKLASSTTASVSSGSGPSSVGSDEQQSPSTSRTTPSPSPQLKDRSLEPEEDMNPSATESSSSPPTSVLSRTVVPSSPDAAPSSPPLALSPAPHALEAVPRVPALPNHVGSVVKHRIAELWREVIAPLFECTCPICSRAADIVPGGEEMDLDRVDILQQAATFAEFERAYRNGQVPDLSVVSDDELDDYGDEDEYEEDEQEEEWDDVDQILWHEATQTMSRANTPSPQPISPEIEPLSASPASHHGSLVDDDTSDGAGVKGVRVIPIAGERRSRDPEDEGGPGSEIVEAEGDIGHGRKRLKA